MLVSEFFEGSPFTSICALPQDERNRIGEIIFRFYIGSLSGTTSSAAIRIPGTCCSAPTAGSRSSTRTVQPHGRRTRRVREAVTARRDGGAQRRSLRADGAPRCHRAGRRRHARRVPRVRVRGRRVELVDEEIAITPEMASTGFLLATPRASEFSGMKSQNLPPEHLFSRRADFLTFGVLGQLDASANWHRIGRAWGVRRRACHGTRRRRGTLAFGPLNPPSAAVVVAQFGPCLRTRVTCGPPPPSKRSAQDRTPGLRDRPRATPGFTGNKADGERMLEERGAVLSSLQEKLYANGRSGDKRSVLLILQGMDTAGKGGMVRHVIGHVDPQGVDHAPSGSRRPRRSAITTVADQQGTASRRAVGGVRPLALRGRPGGAGAQSGPARRVGRPLRGDQPVRTRTGHNGTTIVKVAMFCRGRAEAPAGRATRAPRQVLEVQPGDVTERKLWPQYQEAYQAMLDKTSTEHAPWYVVPCDRKWYSRIAVTDY